MNIGPLLSLIQKRKRFTEREASLVTKEVANALSFLHERGFHETITVFIVRWNLQVLLIEI